jgi:Rrf2 family transcriptional regulator, iron-sulfur cluster assembly transcription factor
MLTQTATYAIRAMGYLASRNGDGPILSQTIADEMEIPKNFLSKIMHQLVRANLVRSIRGTKGGFELARNPSSIKMKEIVSLYIDINLYMNCFLGRTECNGSCSIHKKWEPIVNLIEDMLENTTIDAVI